MAHERRNKERVHKLPTRDMQKIESLFLVMQTDSCT